MYHEHSSVNLASHLLSVASYLCRITSHRISSYVVALRIASTHLVSLLEGCRETRRAVLEVCREALRVGLEACRETLRTLSKDVGRR